MRWELQQALIIERMERMEKKIEMLYEKNYGIPYPQHSQTMSTSFPQSNLIATQKPKNTKAQPPPDFSGVMNLASHRRSQHLLVLPTPDNRRQQQSNMPHHRHRLHQPTPPTDQTKAPPPLPQICVVLLPQSIIAPSQPCLHPICQCRRLCCLTPDRGSPK
jgi:hypothetical protein